MNLSYKWLQDYTPCDLAPRAYAEAMSLSGSKVEGWSSLADEIKNVVVGQVVSIAPHPRADKLVICQVEVGRGEPLQICTGADNLKPGDKVPVALHDSDLPGGVHIQRGELRGEISDGMMCSFAELGLTIHDCPDQREDGIMVLEPDAVVGQDIVKALELDDLSVEFEITSNRPDCLSMIGLARETAATLDRPLHLPAPTVERESGDIADYLKVDVESDLCLRYAARVIKNVKIGPSPKWMRDRLRVCGVRPISNIVDITNYVMLEYGNPMHAFDYDRVAGHHIIVRTAREGEHLVTLDDVDRTLTPEMLVIADEAGPSVVAGIMGGEQSGISDETTTVIFEGACFSGPSVRRTSKKLGLRSESSARYEKGLDPNTCMSALMRACQLVEELGCGEVVGGVIDCYKNPLKPWKIALDEGYMNRFLGIDIPRSEMEEYLTRLGFGIDGGDVVVPTFRADVEHKADVAEEIARIYGYDKIPATLAKTADEAELTEEQKFKRAVGGALVGMGLNEIITYTFISPKYYDKIDLPAESPLRDSVTIRNPLGEDTSVMRTTAIPSMLEVLARNYANRNLCCQMYEIATEYRKQGGPDDLPDESEAVLVGMYGGESDFYRLKGIVENLLEATGVKDAVFLPEKSDPTFHPGRCAKLLLGGEEAGTLGEIHPHVAQNYGIKQKVYLARIPLAGLLKNARREISYRPLPKFPATTRDLALVCDEAVLVGDISRAIAESAGSLLEGVEFFDIYRGKQIGEGKKSVAYKLIFRSDSETLKDEHADAAVERVLAALKPLGITLRS